jgi:hypothetical protein
MFSIYKANQGYVPGFFKYCIVSEGHHKIEKKVWPRS